MTRPTAGLLLLALVLTGCSGPSDDDASPRVTGTPRALAAAVIETVAGPAGAEASAAAPLFPRDGVRSSDLGVEVAFPAEVGEDLHVRVVATRAEAPASDDLRCDGLAMDLYAGCEQDTRDDGTRTVLTWTAGAEAPESDPGTMVALARRGTEVVQATAHGPVLSEDITDQRELAEALLDLVADPAVGLETSSALVEEGEAITDDVWSDWFGQDDGVPAPR